MNRSAVRLLSMIAAIALSSFGVPAFQAQDNGHWARLQFLIGRWSGAGSGQPGQAIKGGTAFSFDLDKQIIVRKNRAEYAPKPGEKTGAVHEDLMIIYQGPGTAGFKAIYFDNEGHTITYDVSFAAQGQGVVFDSEGNDKGPRFRLLYEPTKDGALTVEFFVAPPGGELKCYLSGTIKREA